MIGIELKRVMIGTKTLAPIKFIVKTVSSKNKRGIRWTKM